MIIARLQDKKLIHKSQYFLPYTSNEQVEFVINDTLLFILVAWKMKYLSINLTKYVEDLHEENY